MPFFGFIISCVIAIIMMCITFYNSLHYFSILLDVPLKECLIRALN